MSSSSSAITLTAPPTFTGVSGYASSLQQVLTRAVEIASLPLDSDESALTTLQSQQSAVQGLDNTFTNLQSSVSSLQNALSSTLLTSTVSDPTVVSASVGAGATAGTYSIDVQNLGSYSSALSVAGDSAVSDPTSQGISSSGTFTLNAGGVQTTITPSGDTLDDLVNAINSQAGGEVQAAVVNVGSTSSPDYRLSLQATSLGDDSITLTDADGGNLIDSSSTGLEASYTVNGISTPIQSTSRNITLAPGLTATLVGQSTSDQPTTITVSDDASGIASAFSNFASSYNSAVSALAQYHGQNGGALEGDSLVQTLSNVLSQLGTYSNGSPASSLANYGITLDESGNLDVDTGALTSAANADFPAFLSALGTSTTGGFLGTATNLLNGLEDPTTGIIKNVETDINNEVTAQQTKITNDQAQVTQIQTNLTQQISQADSTIASLESQVSYVTGLFAQYTGATNNQNGNSGSGNSVTGF